MKKELYFPPDADVVRLETENNCLVVGSPGNEGDPGQIGEGGNYGF